MPRLRFLTFNIAHGRGLTPIHQSLRSTTKIRANLLKIAALIKRLGADLVAVQEVDENSSWNGSFNHLTFLSEHCGLPFSAIGLTNVREGRYPLNYGNGVLSRWPILHAESANFGRRQLGDKGFLFTETELAPWPAAAAAQPPPPSHLPEATAAAGGRPDEVHDRTQRPAPVALGGAADFVR